MLPFTAVQQLAVKLLVTSGSFDGIQQLLGFDQVFVLVFVQVVRWGDVDGPRGRPPVDAL